jgi:AraC-like DNA-binding protein
VRERFAEPCRLDMLARRCHATPSRLREEFRAEYGMSIREYQQVLRMMRGLDRMAFEKVEAVAYAVGYRSKKNFYRAFQKVTGVRLDAYRRLSPEGSAKVRESVARRLLTQ